ncbi:hypothetical protein [Campylobacter devanensis]|uniref:hypothetical protein n=1 Tax=Campylobacter devanensis TaxID=3161138 RepID=UPI000A343D76|nr:MULTISPECIES: hypothetical protein [unclassified Campylobacter]
MNKKSKDLKKIIFVETFTKSANKDIKYLDKICSFEYNDTDTIRELFRFVLNYTKETRGSVYSPIDHIDPKDKEKLFTAYFIYYPYSEKAIKVFCKFKDSYSPKNVISNNFDSVKESVFQDSAGMVVYFEYNEARNFDIRLD